jgi:ribonucleoside-diphosphate reductase alpha chain
MQWANQTVSGHPVPVAAATPPTGTGVLPGGRAEQSDYKVIRRNGSVVGFEQAKISIAMTKAFLAVNGGQGAASARVREQVESLTQAVVSALMRRMPSGGTLHIEDIQDQVELSLMRGGEHEVARSYVLYRESRAQERARARKDNAIAAPSLTILENGVRTPFDAQRIRALVEAACEGLNEFVSSDVIVSETIKNLYDGVPIEEVHKSAILAARSQLEKDPAYSKVTARLLLHTVRAEVLHGEVGQAAMAERYVEYFPKFIKRGIDIELLDERLGQYDLERLGAALDSRRDLKFDYLGLQTLYDRYFLIDRNDPFSRDGRRIELPQAFFMRVAMGLALNEIDREARAIEFYEILSSFDFMSSTPTLFNAGTRHSQLSSCYLTTVSDDLDGIYEAIKENALLAKYAGGLGNDWTPVRALGSHIKGTNGESQGVVPFLKVVNDTAVAVNQCFAPDTRVFTANGARAIRDLQRGDLVLTQHGDYREIAQHLTYNQVDPMVEVKVKHSLRPLRVTAGHPIFALRGVPLEQSVARTSDWLKKGKVKAEWADAGQLAVGDYVAMVVPSEIVPVAGFGEEDARLYGVLLGDGEHHAARGEWTISGNPARHEHLSFVRTYLTARGVPFTEVRRDERHCQIRWSQTVQGLREASSGRVVDGASVPISREDLYDATGRKHIAPRLSHLPRSQTLGLLQGLIESDGGVSRGAEIFFTTSSEALAEGVRYQLLRVGVPCGGQCRERDRGQKRLRRTVTGDAGQVSKTFDLRIPAVAEIAERIGCKALTKHNWIEWGGALFSRVRAVNPIAPVPFVCDLKVEGTPSYMTEAGLAHNGGKRKGAVCCYLESWHLDIEEFLELRKNTGDDRRRTHDMNTANWIPDLFMKRVMENGEWTLFSPSSVPDLHDKVGRAFEEAYVRYEARAARGEIKPFKKIQASTLWRKMLSMLFETGHPWITFKDPCNIRSPQQHVGMVHSSNLCTEITLNTNDSEIAVCNLGSVNLVAHMQKGADGAMSLDQDKLKKTVRTAMRMLDNVIDINYYAVKKARDSNLRHRPVGLGIMGFQDCLHMLRVPYASSAAVEFADRSMEAVCYQAYWASTELAQERGRYSSYRGSLWDRGILPQDTLKLLAEERGGYVEVDSSETLDWAALRARISQFGMRNSNCVAIAPTATISNIIGVSACIEPTFENLYVKSNLSGEFTIVNDYLVRDLKRLGLWDEVMVADLKFFDGSLAKIDRIPVELREIYATAFEVEPKWLVEAGSRRQKWIDQAQSLNIYMSGVSGKRLDETYRLAWLRGLKTTYYLRTLSASSAEKSTGRGGELNSVGVDGGMPGASAARSATPLPEPEVIGAVCMLKPGDSGYEECEACQ